MGVADPYNFLGVPKKIENQIGWDGKSKSKVVTGFPPDVSRYSLKVSEKILA